MENQETPNEPTPWNKPHPFMPLTDDLCKCYRWKDDPIHIGGLKVENIAPEPVLSNDGKRKY